MNKSSHLVIQCGFYEHKKNTSGDHYYVSYDSNMKVFRIHDRTKLNSCSQKKASACCFTLSISIVL